MQTALNSPLEVGVRTLFLLVSAYPRRLDVNRLVLLDHSLLNSADLDGPESIHPALATRTSELGVKRTLIQQGLRILLRAELVQMSVLSDGIVFSASESAYGFTSILSTSYASMLRDRSGWAVDSFADLSEDALRSELHVVFGSWSEEFDISDQTLAGEG